MLSSDILDLPLSTFDTSIPTDKLISEHLKEKFGPVRVLDVKLKCESNSDGTFDCHYIVRIEPINQRKTENSSFSAATSSASSVSHISWQPVQSGDVSLNTSFLEESRLSARSPLLSATSLIDSDILVPDDVSLFSSASHGGDVEITFKLTARSKETYEKVHFSTTERFGPTLFLRDVVWWFRDEVHELFLAPFCPRMALVIGSVTQPVLLEDMNKRLHEMCPGRTSKMEIIAENL